MGLSPLSSDYFAMLQRNAFPVFWNGMLHERGITPFQQDSFFTGYWGRTLAIHGIYFCLEFDLLIHEKEKNFKKWAEVCDFCRHSRRLLHTVLSCPLMSSLEMGSDVPSAELIYLSAENYRIYMKISAYRAKNLEFWLNYPFFRPKQQFFSEIFGGEGGGGSSASYALLINGIWSHHGAIGKKFLKF